MAKDKVFTKTRPEELPGILTKDIFNELAGYNKAPCISILMPTHKAGMEVNEQVDLSTFKSSLQQVEKKLKEKKVEQTTIINILRPGHDLLKNNDFWVSLTNGLAVYIADGFFKYVRLGTPVIPLIQVNSSFYNSVDPLYGQGREFLFAGYC